MLAEHRVEMPATRVALRRERCAKLRIAVVAAARAASAASLRRVVRQRVRLLVVAILQAMLDVAQEHVGVAQLARAAWPAAGRALRAAASAGSVPRARSAGSRPPRIELQRLHDELDLADAAGAELDVVAR